MYLQNSSNLIHFWTISYMSSFFDAIFVCTVTWWIEVWEVLLVQKLEAGHAECSMVLSEDSKKTQHWRFRMNIKDTDHWDTECVFLQLLPFHAVSVAVAKRITSQSSAPLWHQGSGCGEVCLLGCVAVSFTWRQTYILESQRSFLEAYMHLSRCDKLSRSYCKPEVWRESKNMQEHNKQTAIAGVSEGCWELAFCTFKLFLCQRWLHHRVSLVLSKDKDKQVSTMFVKNKLTAYGCYIHTVR